MLKQISGMFAAKVYKQSGLGVTKPISFRYFPIFSVLLNHMLAIEYHVYIWLVSPQLSCGDTRQIWMWLNESNS